MKHTTITSNRDYQRIYRRGRSIVSPVLVTYAFKTKNNNLRIGITTSKKVGKAVKRNRCRRVIRAALAHLQADDNASCILKSSVLKWIILSFPSTKFRSENRMIET